MNPLWTEIAGRAGATLSPRQHELLGQYLDLLLAANQRMNLTRITDRESAELHHVGDALTLLRYLPPGSLKVADVGSGGGVPGMPLAIARPDAQILLIESTRKKAAFLTDASQKLGLQNLRVCDQRAEDAGRSPKLRESFDVVVARAVATLDWLAEWCLPLVKNGGRMLAMKGERAAAELPVAGHAIRLMGGGSPDVHPADLRGAHHHVIVEIRKIRRSPAAYPRPATQAKTPL